MTLCYNSAAAIARQYITTVKQGPHLPILEAVIFDRLKPYDTRGDGITTETHLERKKHVFSFSVCLSLMASVHHGSLEVLQPHIMSPSAARQPLAGMAISQMSAVLLSPFLTSTLFRHCMIRENYSRGSHQGSTLETCMEPEEGQKRDQNNAK